MSPGAPIVAAINTLSVSELNEGTKTMIGRLLPALQEVAPEIRQLLVCSKANRHLFAHDVATIEVDLDHARVLRRVFLDQTAVPRLVKGRADVLLTAAGVASLPTSLPQVSLVSHHFALPSNQADAGLEGPGRLRRLYYGPAFRLALRRSAVVLGISRYLADGLVRELGVDPGKVEAMPLGVDPPPRPPRLEGRDPVVLYVGTLYPYKDVPVVIRSFARVRADLPQGARLAVVGKDPDGTQLPSLRALCAELGVADAVDLLGTVADGELEALYAQASVLVLPSRCEGFGLPVAEAMSRGMPVIVAGTTALPEVAGDGGLVVPTGDVDGFAGAIRLLLTDESLRLDLAAAGLRRGSELTWERTATILAAALHRAAGR